MTKFKIAWVKTKSLTLLMFIVFMLFSVTIFAGDSTSLISTGSLPTTTTPRMQCPQFIFNDQPALTSTSTAVSMGGAEDCETVNDTHAGIVVITGPAVITINGTMGPVCPSDHPFMTGVDEVAGTTLGGHYGISYNCCAPPNPPVKLVDDTTTWSNASSCP